MFRMQFVAGGGAFAPSIVRGSAETTAEMETAVLAMFGQGYDAVVVKDSTGAIVMEASAWVAPDISWEGM